MVVIAIAGGTGGMGSAIVDELKPSKEYQVVVLGRKTSETAKSDQDPDAPILSIDYDDVDATALLLKNNNVHTIISTIHVLDETGSTAQVNLIKAAAKSGSVKRFVPSEWGPAHGENHPSSPAYALRKAAVTALGNTDLEWTRFNNGIFLDYYGIPYIKSTMKPLGFFIDVKNTAAGIPGTGDEVLAFTYTADVAKFVVASLGLPKWEDVSYVYGDKSTWNTVLKLAEEARGVKFTVAYDSVEKLKTGQVTELPSHTQLYETHPKPKLQGLLSLLALWCVEGNFDVPADKALNSRFPEIETVKVKDMLALWKGH
ncbi:hypothetical protein ABW20_dc0104407 [Dactylellina cionopaga]|nr:hypothetical protein ABW20_dc0104407 [Dactylellina cionopaga]